MVNFEILVVLLKVHELFLSHFLVGDRIQFELLGFSTVSEGEDQFRLALFDFVEDISLPKRLDHANDVRPAIGHSDEGLFDSNLEVSEFDPLAQFTAAKYDLLELLQLDLLDFRGNVGLGLLQSGITVGFMVSFLTLVLSTTRVHGIVTVR